MPSSASHAGGKSPERRADGLCAPELRWVTSIQSPWGLHIGSLVSTFPWKSHGSSETWKGSLVVLKRLIWSSLLPLENRGHQQRLGLGLPANCPRADPARASSEPRMERDPMTRLPGQGPAHSPSPSPSPN